jgi:hypothetical protein
LKLFRKDLASDYGVDLRTIDRWKHEKVLPSPRRTPSGQPYWTDKQIQRAECSTVKRINEAEKKRAAIAAKLLKKKSRAKINSRQYNLPLQPNLPFKF